MIPTIIYFLLRRYRRNHPVKAASITLLMQKASRIFLLLMLLLLIGFFAIPQETQLQYTIKRKGSEVGLISFSQQHSGNKQILRIESNVKARMIFLFTAMGHEQSIFENGVLVWSSIYQKFNGRERLNKKTQLTGSAYVVTKGKGSTRFDSFPISYNMICLFAREPVHIAKVYSDAFERFLDIQTLADHYYKIEFPDGNYNEYYYNNGLCTRVEVHHRLYRSSFELKNN